MQIEFSRVVQVVADADGGEISPTRIWELFEQTYLTRSAPFRLAGFTVTSEDDDTDRIDVRLERDGQAVGVSGRGNGPIAAFVNALAEVGVDARVLDYAEHATGAGQDSQAASYLEVAVGGTVLWGCGIHPSIVTSSLRAIVGAVNRAATP